MSDKENPVNPNKLMRNAAIAMSLIPLLDNIDESLGEPWTEETFQKTDKAMDDFVNSLESLGFAFVPLVSLGESLDRTKQVMSLYDDAGNKIQ